MRRNGKLRPVDFLSGGEDLWVPDSMDTGAPGPHLTEALPGLRWAGHHGQALTQAS